METVIEPSKSLFRINWREVVEYRDLLILLARRDITVVYKQTLLGPLWFVIQPVIMSIIFTVIFGRVAKIPTDGMPRFVFYMGGLVMWNYFSAVLNNSGTSLIGNANLLSKVYFPRMVIPLSAVVSNLAHLLVNLGVFAAFYVYFYVEGTSIQPTWWILALPLLIAYTALVGLGFGLWVAAITTKYRDMRLALPFVLQIWMYASPIFYSASGVAEPFFRAVLWANPMTVSIQLNRYIFTGMGGIGVGAVLQGLVVTALVLVSGIVVFNRVQRNFVDTI
jgi:lipopolysaccharide transport system permease protein